MEAEALKRRDKCFRVDQAAGRVRTLLDDWLVDLFTNMRRYYVSFKTATNDHDKERNTGSGKG